MSKECGIYGIRNIINGKILLKRRKNNEIRN